MHFILTYPSSGGDKISCTKAVKGADFITCYEGDSDIISFEGIKDFSGYALTDEKGNSVEFSEPEIDEMTQLQIAMAELYEEVLKNG